MEEARIRGQQKPQLAMLEFIDLEACVPARRSGQRRQPTHQEAG
jgi:hypothetical protein